MFGVERPGLVRRGETATGGRAYEQALRSAGIEVDPALALVSTRLDAAKAGSEGVGILLAREPSALFFYNDMMAIGGLRALADQGVLVPGDLSVIGFDDLEISALVTPPLTTMSQPRFEMGRVATEQLLAMLKGEVASPRLETACTLVVRHSTASPRRA